MSARDKAKKRQQRSIKWLTGKTIASVRKVYGTSSYRLRFTDGSALTMYRDAVFVNGWDLKEFDRDKKP